VAEAGSGATSVSRAPREKTDGIRDGNFSPDTTFGGCPGCLKLRRLDVGIKPLRRPALRRAIFSLAAIVTGLTANAGLADVPTDDPLGCLSRNGNLVSNSCNVNVYCYSPGVEIWSAIPPTEVVRATSSDNSHDGAVFRYPEDTEQCSFDEIITAEIPVENVSPPFFTGQTAAEAFAPLSDQDSGKISTGGAIQ